MAEEKGKNLMSTSKQPSNHSSNSEIKLTPKLLADRFRRRGIFDGLRRELIKQFQASDSKTFFDDKLDAILREKLAADRQRRQSSQLSNRSSAGSRRQPPAPQVLGNSVGMNATPERHADVMRELERHTLYDRTLSDIETRFLPRSKIEDKLFELLDETKPPEKRRKLTEKHSQPSIVNNRSTDCAPDEHCSSQSVQRSSDPSQELSQLKTSEDLQSDNPTTLEIDGSELPDDLPAVDPTQNTVSPCPVEPEALTTSPHPHSSNPTPPVHDPITLSDPTHSVSECQKDEAGDAVMVDQANSSNSSCGACKIPTSGTPPIPNTELSSTNPPEDTCELWAR